MCIPYSFSVFTFYFFFDSFLSCALSLEAELLGEARSSSFLAAGLSEVWNPRRDIVRGYAVHGWVLSSIPSLSLCKYHPPLLNQCPLTENHYFSACPAGSSASAKQYLQSQWLIFQPRRDGILGQRDQEGKALAPCFLILSPYKLLLCLFFMQQWTLQLRPPGPALIISLQLILFTAILLAGQSCQDWGSFLATLLFLQLHCSWGLQPGPG